MTDLLIMKVIEPKAIVEAYNDLLDAVRTKFELDLKMKDLEYEIQSEYANVETQGLIDGKNEETRKNQRFYHTEVLQHKKHNLEREIMEADNDIKIKQMFIDMHKQAIRYFSTVAE
jgi:hypothetical protein